MEQREHQIQIQNYLFCSNWYKAGIVYLQDLQANNDVHNIMSYEQIEQTVSTNGGLLFEYYALVKQSPSPGKLQCIATTG